MISLWLAIAGLGAYHGLDPSMGWLFAVALGLQDGSRARVLWALIPIAIGHLVSVAAVVAIIGGLGLLLALPWLRSGGAALLIAFGLFRLVWPRAHPRWVAMHVNFGELALWSFLMASAHGAGLMLFPILLAMHPAGNAVCAVGTYVGLESTRAALAVVCLHTGAMLVTTAVVALLVYSWIGLAILRRAWLNLDSIWAGALIVAGAITFLV